MSHKHHLGLERHLKRTKKKFKAAWKRHHKTLNRAIQGRLSWGGTDPTREAMNKAEEAMNSAQLALAVAKAKGL